MQPGWKKDLTRAGGAFLACLVTGLLIYDRPPTSGEELLLWVWQPALQGILSALAVFGVTKATATRAPR